METWRFLPYQTYSAAENMAIDEAIMWAHREGKVPPTLRFYGWEPAALSIGYFQQVNKEVCMDQVNKESLGFVRRLTGGRAVLHDQELTYSLIVSEKYPGIPQGVSASYQVFSQGLLEGYRQLGLSASLTPPRPKGDAPYSSACFDAPSDYELVVEGRKVAGSAQTRQKGVVLQHGSIPLEIDFAQLLRILPFSNPEKAGIVLKQKAKAIRTLRKKETVLDDVIIAFFHGFRQGLGVQLEIGELTMDEKHKVDELIRTKYGTDAWNFAK